MIPFCKVENHVQECRDCEWPPLQGLEKGLILAQRFDRDNDWTFKTRFFNYEGKLVFCRVFKKNGMFTVDVGMKGSLEECKEFWIKAAILDANCDYVEPAVKTSFQPRPLKEDNKPGFCLMVPFNLMSEVGKYNAVDDETIIEVEIKVVKA